MVAIPALAAACSFSGGGNTSGDSDAGGGGVDSGRAAPARAAHVPSAGERYGTGDVVLSSGVINTTSLSISGGLPPGVEFEAWDQELFGDAPDGLREIAVLYTADFRITPSAQVRVTGDRPLVVLAGGAVEIMGILDGSADRDQPGPGGHAGGPGSGGDGSSAVVNARDGGGGGGGFGAEGGAGGNVACDVIGCIPALGGNAGSTYGDPAQTYLLGGSAGGHGGGCDGVEGAGGGAIQITARDSISIAGVIHVGGGGGDPGDDTCFESPGGGSGGGSGGAIFFEAPVVSISGTVAANGGGGGAGFPGASGEDALAGTAAAPGGAESDSASRPGGDGATGIAAAGAGGGWFPSGNGNAGGAGGGVGRITTVTGDLELTGTASPAIHETSN